MVKNIGRKKETYRLERGFSLIELVVAVSVLSVVLGAMATMTSNMIDAVTYAENKAEKSNLERSILLEMKSSTACENTFLGLDGTTTSPQNVEIKNASNRTILKKNDSSINKLKGLEIKDINLSLTAPIGSKSSGSGSLTINVHRKSDGGGPKELRPIELPVRVFTDNTGVIAGCETRGGVITMLNTPIRVHNVNTGEQVTDYIRHYTNNLSTTIVPSDADYALLRFRLDMNHEDGNPQVRFSLGESNANLRFTSHLDTGKNSDEAQNGGMIVVPIDPDNPKIVAKMELTEAGSISGSKAVVYFSVWLDGFVVSSSAY